VESPYRRSYSGTVRKVNLLRIYRLWWEKKEVRSNDDYLDAFDSKPVRIEKALKPKKQSWLCRLICGVKK
jgi:hypothetical protein